MKKLLLILFFLPFVSFGQTVTVRDIDLTKTFVVRCTAFSNDYNDEVEDMWNTALFENGLDVGSYYIEKVAKDTNNREMELKRLITINGTYWVKIESPKRVEIQDWKNKKIVGTITFKKGRNGGTNLLKFYTLQMADIKRGLEKPKKINKAIEIMIKKLNSQRVN